MRRAENRAFFNMRALVRTEYCLALSIPADQFDAGRLLLCALFFGFGERIFVGAGSVDRRYLASHRAYIGRQLPTVVNAVAQGESDDARGGLVNKPEAIDDFGGFLRRIG